MNGYGKCDVLAGKNAGCGTALIRLEDDYGQNITTEWGGSCRGHPGFLS